MSKTLLLADDSVVIQKLVGLSFASEDVEIVSTDNGDDAVTKAREIRPDVVLADVVMPGKSGYEVCEALKQDPTLAHIPVLLLTGTFEAFDEGRAQAAGATGHITKPFEAQALVERVKTVIKNASAAAAASPAASSAMRSGGRSEVGQAVPSRPDFALADAPLADDLFTDDDPILSSPGQPSYFGSVESLDVTPSIGEEDLSDALDPDLFGPPGDVGGATPHGAESFSAAVSSLDVPELDVPEFEGRGFRLPAQPSSSDASFTGSIGGSTESATAGLVAEPLGESWGASASGDPAFATELGLDYALEAPSLPAEAFDLDSAFDPEPPQAPVALGFARDDANAATSRSLERPVTVTDLDEFLAAPQMPAPRPEAPTRLELGPVEQSGSDLDFGFDVSEQATLSNVDLLEESFSSLLDVSDSQILGESTPFPAAPPASAPASPPVSSAASQPPAFSRSADAPSLPSLADLDAFETALPLASESEPFESTSASGVEFDVSSSDLAATAFAQVPPDREVSAIDSAPPASLAFDRAAIDVPPPLPASALSGAARRSPSVDDMSPILQQQVQETLEKVAWEAFSDLSETIVKQVIERIERIAWEVIPQMAETLVREEIRKMKGDVE